MEKFSWFILLISVVLYSLMVVLPLFVDLKPVTLPLVLLPAVLIAANFLTILLNKKKVTEQEWARLRPIVQISAIFLVVIIGLAGVGIVKGVQAGEKINEEVDRAKQDEQLKKDQLDRSRREADKANGEL